ncbi:MAG TPA: hypothetical protein VG735_00820 [Caulobacterales bacterium]|nr:hypothetical protein [Caulobacterales bacterium]
MQIVHGDEVEIRCDGGGVRTGKVGKQIMLTGDPESPDNFKYGLFHQYGSFFSPRHRHNFCQIRAQLEGDCKYGKTITMRPGTVGYFPEGVHYGPQGPDVGDTYTATLQFGGLSGSGLLTTQQLADAKRELSKTGTFENGIFHRNEGEPGKRNVDGFEAVWEQIAGRKLVYPEAQYAEPIFMYPENYRWVPISGSAGVEEKSMGSFAGGQVKVAHYRVSPGATFTAKGRGVFLVLSGGGDLEGEKFRIYTSLYLNTGEKAQFKANRVSEILLMGMPDLAEIRKYSAFFAARQGAEQLEYAD